MTKRDFIGLAETLITAKRHCDPRCDVCYTVIVAEIADFLSLNNPRFKRDRWMGYILGVNGPSGGQK